MTQGERRDQHRGWELRNDEVQARHLADDIIDDSHLNPSVFGAVGTITTIDPDDAAAAGASGKVADAAHQHAFTSGTASSLAKTASNSEGSSSSHARADHGHATDALPWGLLAAPATLTSNSSATSGTTELDLAVDITATVTSGRKIRLEFSCRNLIGSIAGDLFEIRFKENSTQVAAFRVQVHETTAHMDLHTCRHVYTPTAGSRTFEVFLVRVGGTGNANVVASSTEPAVFTVEDIGA